LQLSGDGVVTGLDSAASSDLGASLAAKLDSTAYQPGLVLITSESFTAVSSVSVNGCFTTTYDAYRIIYRLSGSAGTNLEFRVRGSGSDATTNYDRQFFAASDGSVVAGRDTSVGSTVLGSVANGVVSEMWMDIYGPALAGQTGGFSNNRAASPVAVQFRIFAHTTATAYDGFSIFPTTGTITGNLRVYGYRD